MRGCWARADSLFVAAIVIHLAPGVAIDAARLRWSQVRSGGPGGQHVNTTASQVELRLDVVDLALRPAAAERLARLASHWLTDAGELVLTCSETRSAGRNRDLLIERLSELLVEACTIPKPRRKSKPTRASKERRLEAKNHRTRTLSNRRED